MFPVFALLYGIYGHCVDIVFWCYGRRKVATCESAFNNTHLLFRQFSICGNALVFSSNAFLLTLFRCFFCSQSTISKCWLEIKPLAWLSRLVETNPFLLKMDKLVWVCNLFDNNPFKCIGSVLIPCMLKIRVRMILNSKPVNVILPPFCYICCTANIDTGRRCVDDPIDTSNILIGWLSARGKGIWRGKIKKTELNRAYLWYTFHCRSFHEKVRPRPGLLQVAPG